MITLEQKIEIAEWAGWTYFFDKKIWEIKEGDPFNFRSLFTESAHFEALRQVILSKGYKFELEGYFCKGEPKFSFQIFHNIDLSNDSYHSYDEKECQLKAVLQLINKEKLL